MLNFWNINAIAAIIKAKAFNNWATRLEVPL